MSPRRELYRTKDGRNYTLWADVNDMMSAVMPAYWSNDRNRRRERGWMFRGQTSSEWDLLPSLYRPPFDGKTFNVRKKYTEDFVNDLQKKTRKLGMRNLTDLEHIAIAQHYGFYTSLLDFTWNAEIAAYFATEGIQQGEVGILFAFNAKEYKEMRNPFAALGTSVEDSDKILRGAGMETLPELEIVELYNIPRIFAQEGVFINVTPEKVETLLHECIDRFYFRQRKGLVYKGTFPHRLSSLPSPSYFDSKETYESFIEIVRKEKPELFDRTNAFGKDTIFPPADPLSRLAEQWKKDHPDPTAKMKDSVTFSPQSISKPVSQRFSSQMESYYYGTFSRSPYQPKYLAEGRKLVEFLCQYSELDNNEVQRWLLWELYKRNLPSGLKCTVKLGNAESWGSQEKGVQVVVVDRWLADSYQHTISNEQLTEGFWQIKFGRLSSRGRPETAVKKIQPFPLPTREESLTKWIPSNPHDGGRAPQILSDIEAKLVGLEEGTVGSFLYDLHHVVMIEMGRNLQLEIGWIESAPCLQASPLVRPEHSVSQFLTLRIYDMFTGGYTHTAVCAKHVDCMSEGEEDMMNPHPWMLLGLA